ncbi:glycoside hydrolase family 2 protein [Herbiconiux sp. 11R-BC]|uniref:glycoside hydrolase family 2 protein n=1 Tax=Herbiconiux sp. 11R-BC TaxID=3111637 RepID=UPI003BFBA20C
MLSRTVLADGWTGRLDASVPAGADPRLAEAFPAAVPGSVHADLLSAGLIPDPFDGTNEEALRWIGDSDWVYATSFARPADAADRTELVFEGLDTVAVVLVNGREVAATENMHRTYRIPLAGLAEVNELEVRFSAPRPAAAARREQFGERPTAFSVLPPFLRKMACDFGWDWGPDLATSGIWRTAALETWSTARLAGVRPVVGVDGEAGWVRFEVALERAGDLAAALTVEATLAGRTVAARVEPGQSQASILVELESVRRWWPRGRGEQELYPVSVTLAGGAGQLDAWHSRVGFREIVVEQTEDADGEGSGFRFAVNGEPLFVRGVNWIPDDSFISRVTREDYSERIRQATELGANLIRVWGGGVFESEDFYELCDELGVLVWQDFLFACAAYPEDEPYSGEVEAEARDNITRLMKHPSLALWNGNNECVWFWFLRDWENVLDGKTWGEKFYFELLPSLVAELDPQRFYLAGSPYSGARDREPNDPSRGVVHSWIPGDFREYTDIRPRFVSEFGFQGPPSRELFDSVVHDEAPAPFSRDVVQRQKAVGGTERIEDVMGVNFGVPDDFDEWYWLAQLTQARAVGFGIEYFRSLSPWCSGTVVWQLNDCWPAISWSVIDKAARWKPAAYAMRRAFADRVATLQRREARSEAGSGEVMIVLGNEARAAWRPVVTVERWSTSERLAAAELRPEAGALATIAVPVPSSVLEGPLAVDEALVLTADGIRSVLLGGYDKEFPDAPAEFSVQLATEPGGVAVTLTAGSLLRDTCLLPGSIDENAHSDRNLVTLLPGETETWHVSTRHPERFDADAVAGVVHTARAAHVAVAG